MEKRKQSLAGNRFGGGGVGGEEKGRKEGRQEGRKAGELRDNERPDGERERLSGKIRIVNFLVRQRADPPRELRAESLQEGGLGRVYRAAKREGYL